MPQRADVDPCPDIGKIDGALEINDGLVCISFRLVRETSNIQSRHELGIRRKGSVAFCDGIIVTASKIVHECRSCADCWRERVEFLGSLNFAQALERPTICR